MKCKKGHELVKMAYTRGGYYCPICNPEIHEHQEKLKIERARKRKNRKVMNLLNKIYQEEVG
jgi:23S rRNA A1618 N6-methylase RlmF